MTHTIQIGRGSIQGPARDIEKGIGTIDGPLGPVRGALIESLRREAPVSLQTTADRIWGEFCRLSTEDDGVPRRLRITSDVLRTLKADCDRDGYFHDQAWYLAHPEKPKFMTMAVEEVPVGTLDAPCWQIMVTEAAGGIIEKFDNAQVAPVQVCPLCDIAGCRHVRAEQRADAAERALMEGRA